MKWRRNGLLPAGWVKFILSVRLSAIRDLKDGASTAGTAGFSRRVRRPWARWEILEMDAMIEAEERSAGQLMVGHNQRFVKEHEVAKEWIASGRLGEIYSFRTTFGHPGPEGWSVDGRDSWFFEESQAAMGAMGDL